MHIPIAGIIAEYNPLHRGHLYHIQKARELSCAEALIVVLSSNFVQRGEPALTDKWNRAGMAIDCGADLVLELPLAFSVHNAGVFAGAAVDILGYTGIATHLSFGLESPDWQMNDILDILIEEPEPFKVRLKNHLDKGHSYVEARAKALDEMIPGSADKLRGSNNTLALAYMLRIRQKKWNITPVPVQRLGSGYHDKNISEYSSATAIRKSIMEGRISEAISQLPDHSAALVRRAMDDGRICADSGSLWNILRPILLRASPEAIAGCAEIGEGIEYLLHRAALESRSFEEWSSKCTSKRYPRGRIQRHGIHMLLGLGHWNNRAFQRLGPAYIRVLAMNGTGRKLLRRMKTNATLPVITRCGDAAKISDYAKKMMDYECLGAEIWEGLIPNGSFGKEHARKVIMM